MRRLLLCLQVSLLAIALLATPSVAQPSSTLMSVIAPAITPVAAPPAAPAAPAAEPAPARPPSVLPIELSPNSAGAELMVELSEQVTLLGGKLAQLATAVTDFPQLGRWLSRVSSDPKTRASILSASWRLVVVMAAGLLVEFALRRLLLRPLRALRHAAPVAVHEEVPDELKGLAEAELGQSERVGPRGDSLRVLLLRLFFLIGGFLLDLLPVIGLAITGAVFLTAGFAGSQVSRLVIVTVLNGYVLWYVVVAVLRAVLSPATARLRLVHMDTITARSVLHDIGRIAAVAIGGYAVLEDALLFGLYKAAHDALLKLIALGVYVLFARLVLRSRRKVKQALRAPEGRTGLNAALRNAVAGAWHRIVLFYLLSLWVVWALDIANGFDRLLRFMVALAVVALVIRLIDALVELGFEKLNKVTDRLSDSYPGLDKRFGVYHGLARRVINLALAMLAIFGVFAAAGMDVPSWFVADSIGGRILAAFSNILITLAVALFVWEFTNLSIERHLAELTRSAQLSRSARLRTLLPMLRTALLVSVVLVAGLVVLSEIGVNIAPLLAGAGVVGLAIGFGSQKLVQDIITGLFLLLENAMQVGDVVTLGGLSGTVENLSIRTIRLRATDGSVHIVPFSAVTTVTNQTRDYAFAVVDVSVGVNEEPDQICDLLREMATKMRAESPWRAMILADLEVFGIDKFTDYNYVIRIRIKTLPSSRWPVMREMHRRIKHRFDERAIQSPMTSYRALGMETPVITTIIHENGTPT